MTSSSADNTIESVRVWDPLVRIFHWGLAVAFSVAYLTADSAETVHLVAGYGIVALVSVYMLWGVVGPRHARFSDFVFRPGAVWKYLRDLTLGRARRMLGHSPAGGAMVIALFAALGVTCATGIAMSLGTAGDTLEAVHELASASTLALVFAHIAGVLFASFVHRENLPLAMITGRKRPLEEPVGSTLE